MDVRDDGGGWRVPLTCHTARHKPPPDIKPACLALHLCWTYPLLRELPGLLVLGVTEEFHNTLLVRGEAGNLADDGLDESLLLAVGGMRDGCGYVGGDEEHRSA